MVKLGFHVSIAGSLDLAVERAAALSCDTFQMFTRSPRVWAAKPISDGVAIAFKKALERFGIGPAVDHMTYLPNPAAEKPEPSPLRGKRKGRKDRPGSMTGMLAPIRRTS